MVAHSAPPAIQAQPATGIAPPAISPMAAAPVAAPPNSIDADIASQNHAGINLLLSDAIDQIKAGNLVMVFENFASPVGLAQLTPDVKKTLEDVLPFHLTTGDTTIWADVLTAMQTQTPTFNDAGDRATFEISDPTGHSQPLRPITLQKVNGQWYFTITDVLRGAAGFGLTQNPPHGI